MWLVAHFTIQFRLGDQSGHRIDNDDVDCTGSYQGAGDLESLFAAVGLRNQQIIHIHAEVAGVCRIERVLRIDKSSRSARALRLGDDLERDSGLAGGFRSKDFDDPPARHPAHTQSRIDGNRARGDHRNRDHVARSQPEDRALTELLF